MILPAKVQFSLTIRHALYFPAFLFMAIVPAVALAGDDADDADGAKDIQAVQGRWTRQQRTPRGLLTINKTHTGRSTVVTALDADGRVVYEHTSDFKIERTGRLRVFTFFNRVATAGPDKGKVAPKPASFVYRVANDRFVEVYGLLDGDDTPPQMVIWKRVPPEKDAGDAT